MRAWFAWKHRRDDQIHSYGLGPMDLGSVFLPYALPAYMVPLVPHEPTERWATIPAACPRPHILIRAASHTGRIRQVEACVFCIEHPGVA